MDDYIDVYFNGFSDGVYADMEPGYAVTERKSFSNPYKTKLMAFYGKKPVGVVSVDVKGDIAYIESFAILRQYRFGGKMARVLGNAALNVCYAKGASKIFLITAAGTALERLYQSNGFSTKFYGYFYKRGN
jgi:ribosomal protein S18 acetylase RimI-like enzyme